jgi:hypothetical protein
MTPRPRAPPHGMKSGKSMMKKAVERHATLTRIDKTVNEVLSGELVESSFIQHCQDKRNHFDRERKHICEKQLNFGRL